MSGLHLVDLDGDGHLDVVLSSHGSYGALAALGDGTGAFTQAEGDYPTSEICARCASVLLSGIVGTRALGDPEGEEQDQAESCDVAGANE